MKRILFIFILFSVPLAVLFGVSDAQVPMRAKHTGEYIQKCKEKLSSSTELTGDDRVEIADLLDRIVSELRGPFTKLDANGNTKEYVGGIEKDYNETKQNGELKQFHDVIILLEKAKARGIKFAHGGGLCKALEKDLQKVLEESKKLQEGGLSRKDLNQARSVLWKLRFIEPYKDAKKQIASLELKMKPVEAAVQMAVDATNFDIAGIRLGMSFDEAMSAIKKAYPDSKPQVLPPCDRSIYGGSPPHCGYAEKEIYAGKGNARLTAILAKKPYGNGVMDVDLFLNLGHDLTEKEKSSLVDKLIAKYGKPDKLSDVYGEEIGGLDMQYGGTMTWGDPQKKHLIANFRTFSEMWLTLLDPGPGKAYIAKEKEDRRKGIKF